MHKYIDEYGPASDVLEKQAKELFPYTETNPEKYAALEAHNWACFSFDDYIYKDPDLNEWIHTLGDILFTSGGVGVARKKYLTAEEIKEIEKSEKEEL